MINPKKCNIACDANALDKDGSPKDAQVERFQKLVAKREIQLVIPGGVRLEIQHPRTPNDVKNAILPQIFNLRPGLNASQQNIRRHVAAVLRGNAKPETHAADASHLSEASETGCAYFITHDARVLDKRTELQQYLGPTLNIVTLNEFLKIYDEFE